MLSKTDATVLRRHNYGNTSRVLVFHTRRYGQLRLLAKGVRRRPRKRAGEVSPQLFSSGELVFYPSRSGGLGVMSEWCEGVPRKGIGDVASRYFAACYVAEVLEGLTREGEPSAAIFSLTSDALGAVERAENCGTVVSAFELRLLAELGLSPSLADCTVCGRALPGGRAIHYYPAEGGAVCGECAPGGAGPSVDVGPGVVAAIGQLARVGPVSAGGVRLRPGEMSCVREALSGSIASVLERVPTSQRYSKTLEIACRAR